MDCIYRDMSSLQDVMMVGNREACLQTPILFVVMLTTYEAPFNRIIFVIFLIILNLGMKLFINNVPVL